MANVSKVIRVGTLKTYGGRTYSIFCKINFADGRLSITGVEGPLPSGNAIGGYGQINDTLRQHQNDIKLAPKWDRGMLAQFLDIWEKYHLNDMQAGTPEQMAELERRKSDYKGYPTGYYEWACDVLSQANLLEVTHPTQPEVLNANGQYVRNTYEYGHAWISKDVPADVIDFLTSLPDTDTIPAWV